MKKSDIIRKYMDLIGVKYTSTYTDTFNSHPYNNSLYGFYDFLKTYNIQMKSLVFNNILETKNIGCLPLITLLNHHFVIITKIESEIVTYINKDGIEKTVLIKDFEQTWSKNGIYGKKNGHLTGEKDYKINKRRDLIKLSTNNGVIAITLLLISLYSYLNIRILNYVNLFYFLSDFIGLLTCIALCKISINREGKVLKIICSTWKRVNCKRLSEYNRTSSLNSINFPCLGLSYFLVNLILIFFNAINLQVFCIFSCISLMFSIWSILYQAIHKKWCLLCILTMIIIWIQSTILICTIPTTEALLAFTSISVSVQTCIVGLTYLLLYIILDRLLSILKNNERLKIKYLQYNKLKYDINVFNNLISNAYKVNDTNKSIITFGDNSTQTKITILSNPFCNPCSELHSQLIHLIKHDCYIEYFFTYFDQEKALANKYIIAAYLQKGKDFTWNLLNTWYSLNNKDLNFFKQFNLYVDDNSVIQEFKIQEEWVKQSKLDSTPTVLVNSHLLPSIYDLSDLELLINWKE